MNNKNQEPCTLTLTAAGNSNSGHQLTAEPWFEDIDYFVNTLAGVKSRGVRPDLIGSIITHYAAKWLPDLSPSCAGASPPVVSPALNESATVSYMKKRFIVETLIGVLPPEKDSVPCDFLLRLLRTASMVSAEAPYRAELERRVGRQLEQACLEELMIPSFSHECKTLLDVELVLRLVQRYLTADDDNLSKSGLGVVKVAKLIDSYLAEAAVDGGLMVEEFARLAGAIPSHARAVDDGLYRAIDTYLKAHPNATKQERKSLCRLIDSRKLSSEASFHASQNERLPVRAVIQVLLTEQSKLSRNLTADWSGHFTGARSPTCPPSDHRCLSQRSAVAQEAEVRRLRDDVTRLQRQFEGVQAHMERVLLMLDHQKKKQHGGGRSASGYPAAALGFFRWKKLSFRSGGSTATTTATASVINGNAPNNNNEDAVGFERQTPLNVVNMKTKLVRGKTPPKYWRGSLS